MKIPLRKLFPATAFASEALSILALYLSPEVPRYLFYPPLALGLVALVTKLRDRWLLPLIAAVVLGGIFAGFRSGSNMAVAVALPMLAVHGLTWLAREQGRYRYWRIGLAFLEMILAAILSPEAHMFFLIFFFVITVSLTLSFGFLEQNFASRDPAGLDRPLRAAYLGAVLLLSFVIFLSSLAIFPILPRKENMELNPIGAMPGYSEEVSFQTATFYWTGDESRAVMWLFLPKGKSWAELIPFGLLRGKSLEQFNGRTWKQGLKQSGQGGEPRATMSELEILRDPMPTEALPSPYGTESLRLSGEGIPYRYVTGEWYQPTARGRRVSYVAGIVPNAPRDNIVEQSELNLPKEGFERLTALAKTLQKNARSERERIDAVMQFFQNGFSAQQVPVASAAEKGSSPIETFMFETKTGHCELFATGAALLLRSIGLPTRLVVGFRVPIASAATVLTIRNGDAHAWVEVRTADGWMVLDPTPAIPASLPRWQLARDIYDWITAYWHRYILAYEFNVITTLKWVGIVGGGAFGLMILAALVRLTRKILARREAGPRKRVSQAKRFLQKRMKPNDQNFAEKIKAIPGGREWHGRYLELRFGAAHPTEQEGRWLKASASALLREAARAVPPAQQGL